MALIAALLPQLVAAALPWAGLAYERTSVPEEYFRSSAKPMQLSSEYPREGMPHSIKVADLISVYGAPTAAYRPTQQSTNYRSYLVYELGDGYTFAVQLSRLEDSRFYAAMLFDPTGKRVGAIIK